jgi:hypothetical protein
MKKAAGDQGVIRVLLCIKADAFHPWASVCLSMTQQGIQI